MVYRVRQFPVFHCVFPNVFFQTTSVISIVYSLLRSMYQWVRTRAQRYGPMASLASVPPNPEKSSCSSVIECTEFRLKNAVSCPLPPTPLWSNLKSILPSRPHKSRLRSATLWHEDF
ncbi:hypothetical protein RvY_14841-2 [Ramazzottius varieornatus]|uniref:Uncharacterized protein n=1 Tax=Ramazzottius varieornatus TaxID=947166 RepID=A0A1D1VXN3_RAMVA|nr:hypothetical protein RvY_14841-2 [Ramazzottius varieornatus]